MTHTTTWDARFLNVPTSDRNTDLAAGAVAVIKGTKPDHDLVKNLLATRLQPGTDVTRHLHRVALPRPGGDAELFRAIAHAVERPLDQSPWECWIIERLAGNRWAILMRVGQDIPAAHLLARLCDGTETFGEAKPDAATAGDAPSWTDTLWQMPLAVGRATAAALSWPRPAGPVNTLRHYRTVRVPRPTVDALARKFGVGTDDVALAAITEGFRSVLVRRGRQPRPDSLRAVGPVPGYLPVDHEDPIRQLRAVQDGIDPKPPAHSPSALCAKAFHVLTGLPRQETVTLATTAPGPRHRLHLMGRPLERLLPIPPTAHQISTGVAVLSYTDELVFGITAAYDAEVDIGQLVAGIEVGMARLTALGQDSVLVFNRRRKRPRRTVPNGAARWRPSAPPVRVRRR